MSNARTEAPPPLGFLQLQFDVDMQSSTEVIGEASR